MVKFIVSSAVIAGGFWGAVMGVNSLLKVDDLKDCAGPSLAVVACAPADAIVAISGGDTSARAVEAIRLYKAGWAQTLVFSGAALDKTGPSNAEAMREQAISAGVPESAILIETEALDTTENAFRTRALLGQEFDRLILVTSPYHQRRAGLEFAYFLGDKVTVLNHPTPYDRLWPEYWWMSWNGWVLALTEGIKTVIVIMKP